MCIIQYLIYHYRNKFCLHNLNYYKSSLNLYMSFVASFKKYIFILFNSTYNLLTLNQFELGLVLYEGTIVFTVLQQGR